MTNTKYKKIKKCFSNPWIVISKIIEYRAKFLTDKIYLDIFYRASFGESFNWEDPITYNQKMQWLKVNDRKQMYKNMVDKYEVRGLIASKIGEQYLIPLYGVWDSFEEIDFNALPNKFVLKCTHDSGGIIICKNKKTFNKDLARSKFKKMMSRDYFWRGREWPYKDIKPRIIAEKYMKDEFSDDLKDYKVFTFHGEPKMLYVASDRHKVNDDVKFDYFDTDFNKLNIRQLAHDTSSYKIERPKNFDKMLEISKILSQDIPHVRIDLYEINGKVYFGEFTFYSQSGLVPFEPKEYDQHLGSFLNLDKLNNKE